MNLLQQYLIIMIVGFIFGWATNNFIYGRKGCTDCFVALVRGKGCSTCENNKEEAQNG